jgi:sugar/nucleoside kinase (ribokinase family)
MAYLKRTREHSPYGGFVGVGGIGGGLFFALEGDHTLGRNESRPGRLLDVRDYCKLHIVAHYVAVLLGAAPRGSQFHVLPVGMVGDDQTGRAMVQEMAAAGMDTSCVTVAENRPTTLSICFQYPDGSGGNITTSDSASFALTADGIDQALATLSEEGNGYVIAALPEAPLDVRLHLLERAAGSKALRVANFTSAEIAAAERSRMFAHVDILSMNQDEAETLTGRTIPLQDSGPALDRCAEAVLAYSPRMHIVMTMGEHGAFAFDGERWTYRRALPVKAVSTAGAGDALLGGVISALCAGVPLAAGDREQSIAAPLGSALDFGVLVAQHKVTSRHTIHPDANLAAILQFAGEHGLTFSGRLAEAVQQPVAVGPQYDGR